MGALDSIGRTIANVGKAALSGYTQDYRAKEQGIQTQDLLRDIQLIKEAGGPNSEAGRQLLVQAAQKYQQANFGPQQFMQEMTPHEKALEAYYKGLTGGGEGSNTYRQQQIRAGLAKTLIYGGLDPGTPEFEAALTALEKSVMGSGSTLNPTQVPSPNLPENDQMIGRYSQTPGTVPARPQAAAPPQAKGPGLGSRIRGALSAITAPPSPSTGVNPASGIGFMAGAQLNRPGVVQPMPTPGPHSPAAVAAPVAGTPAMPQVVPTPLLATPTPPQFLRTATNPKTGERIGWDGTKWVKIP